MQNSILYISGAQTDATLRVYNILGTTVYQGVVASDKAEIPLPGRGIYIVTDEQEAVKWFFRSAIFRWLDRHTNRRLNDHISMVRQAHQPQAQ